MLQDQKQVTASCFFPWISDSRIAFSQPFHSQNFEHSMCSLLMTLDYASGARGEEIRVSFSYNRPYKLHISLSTPTFMNTIELSQKLIEYKANSNTLNT